MKKLYIAYGSNLNIEQMKYRCPTAKLVSTGTIENCALDFRRISANAYATIYPKKGSFVPVAFWEIDQEAEHALDIYEGYPRFYYKRTLQISSADNSPKAAMVYIMNSKALPGIPSPNYVRTIYQGYLDVGLSVNIFSDICKSCGFSLNDMISSKKRPT